MGSAPTYNSLTLTPPRITAARFRQLLASKNSPATAESDLVYNQLVREGVDPSFALAQFRVESQYGTAGYAKTTGSWGNMLYDAHLTILADGTYSPGNGYTYATYNDYVDAILDYNRYIHWYKDQYGFDTIYEATARWIGKIPGSSGHINYINIIIDDMIRYEYPNGGYESGDKMIYSGAAIDKATGRIREKYPVFSGMQLYRGTDGSPLKKFSGTSSTIGKPSTYAWFTGFVNGGTDWGTIIIGTDIADPNGTQVYIMKPDPKKIIRV